jgi:DNA-directed RNA polymerase I, II, and III subunit RPABC2
LDDVMAGGGIAGANTTTDTTAAERSERITTPYLTKYEKARILGTRALQIRYELYSTTVEHELKR